MDVRQLPNTIPTGKIQEVKLSTLASAHPSVKKEAPLVEPTEVFSPTVAASLQSSPAVADTSSAVKEPEARSEEGPRTLTWQDGGVTYAGIGNGPLVGLQEETPVLASTPSGGGQTLADILKNLSSQIEAAPVAEVQPQPEVAARAMQEREMGYLSKFPYKDGEKALQARQELQVRYHDPTTSAESMTRTVARYAVERGIELDKAPEGLVGDLSGTNIDEVRKATQGIVDKLFLSQEASHNPEKHATVSKETSRFLDLVLKVAPKGFTAADAYKLVAGNLALISYQDKAAAENLLGDHGVRHLLGHNITACESLADGLEKRGVPVSDMDRLVMHQAMIVHDLGYAMDSVRNPINSEGLKGQDAGHNVLAARYLRERSQDPEDPIAKLFGQGDLERMHRCVLFHDKDSNGGPGVQFVMKKGLTPEERATNLESMTRIADNSHAFEDKLPELLYRKPESLKTMRMMKTAGELGDTALLETLKGELAETIRADASLARDDREALLQSVGSIHDKSYQFSVGRIAGRKPSFEVTADGKIELSVEESDTHQQTSALFGMDTHRQMEKFISECAGQKVSLKGDTERIEGQHVCVLVQGPSLAPQQDEFNSELHSKLLADKGFVKFALLDSQLSRWKETLETRQKLGRPGLDKDLQEVKSQRRQVLEQYRSGAAL